MLMSPTSKNQGRLSVLHEFLPVVAEIADETVSLDFFAQRGDAAGIVEPLRHAAVVPNVV
jgi:hypothetical protein